MLLNLYIKNYVLIDELSLDLTQGLTVITGETGAGKSILLGALSLLSAKRADKDTLNDKEQKCIIEGQFDISSYHLKELFEKYELDYLEDTIIRREIRANGSSRAFVNDSPVTLDILKLLSIRLIDIHSQHDTFQIDKETFRINIFDALAKNNQNLKNYRKTFEDWKLKEAELNQLIEQQQQFQKEEDFIKFQLKELEELNLKEGELLELEAAQSIAENSELIQRNLSLIEQLLNNEDGGVLDSLRKVGQHLNELESLKPDFKELAERINSAKIELEDVAMETSAQNDEELYDLQSLQTINDRLSAIYTLQKKHLVDAADELLHKYDELSEALSQIDGVEALIEKTKEELKVLDNSSNQLAKALSKQRQKFVAGFEQKLLAILASIGIKNAQFKVDFKEVPRNEHGIDSIAFLFSANPGKPLQTIFKAASGGELSRLMLAIKKVLAEELSMPTLFFDEIDTGVSGEIADQVGETLKSMSKQRQILTITHLPQMAAKADSHLFVFKDVQDQNTVSSVKLLNKEERIEELAKMLSGQKMSEAAINNAKELLAQ